MADSISLRYGGHSVTFTKSPTQIAVRPALGRGRNLEFTLESIARRRPTERRGRLGPFELVDIQAPPEAVALETERMGRSPAVQEQVPVYHTSDDEVPFVPEGTIYLDLHSDASDDALSDLVVRHDLAVVSSSRGTYAVRSPEPDTLDLAAKLQAEPVVDLAEPDMITPRRLLNVLPDDALLGKQWHLENKGGSGALKTGADARVIAAWNKLGNLGADDVVIAVIDDGVDLGHPDFQGKAVDPWDFIRGTSNVMPEPDRNAPEPGDGHGTACAGVAAGLAGGGEIVGAAPNARLMPLRMTEHLSIADVVAWFDYATANNAWVISCSWNAEAAVYDLPSEIAAAIHRAATEGRGGKGCVVVFAAGNSGRDVNDPPRSKNGFATHPDVLAVAASSSLDRRAVYSDFGREIAVCAPSMGIGGLGITTADVTGTYVDASGVERGRGFSPGAYYGRFRGTSSSCPLVAGICALVLSANPDLTAAQVRQIIRASARKIGNLGDYQDGHSIHFGHGCVHAEAAIEMALAGTNSRGELIALRNLQTRAG